VVEREGQNPSVIIFDFTEALSYAETVQDILDRVDITPGGAAREVSALDQKEALKAMVIALESDRWLNVGNGFEIVEEGGELFRNLEESEQDALIRQRLMEFPESMFPNDMGFNERLAIFGEVAGEMSQNQQGDQGGDRLGEFLQSLKGLPQAARQLLPKALGNN